MKIVRQSKEKNRNYIKNVIILLVISIILQGIYFGYTLTINEIFKKKHFIGNNTKEIYMENIKVTEQNEYVNLEYNGVITEANNIVLVFKEKNQDSYIRLIYDNGEILMQKSNKEQTKMKAYFKQPEDIENFIISFPKSEIEINNIDKLLINDNLNYIAKPHFSIINIIITFLVLMILNVLIKNFKGICKRINDISKVNIFLLLSLTIGMITMIINVPLSKYDEHAHFWRAYEISCGGIKSGSKDLPKEIFDIIIDETGVYHIEDKTSYKYVIDKANTELNNSEKTGQSVGATASLSIFSYLPQTIGILIGKILFNNPFSIVLMARLFNLLSYVILICCAIRLMPKEKWKNITMIVALLPMSMNIASSCSPDALIISFCLLSIAYLLNIKFGNRKMGDKEFIILTILFTIPIVCKIVYLPLVLLFLLLSKNNLKDKKKYWIYFITILILPLIVYFSMQFINSGAKGIAIRTSTKEQFLFTISNPIRDIYVGINTLYKYTPEYFSTMIGGWNTNIFIIYCFTTIILFMTFNDEKETKNICINKRDKIVVSIVLGIIILLIFGGLYVDWTRACLEYVEGVQGRYFLPILILLLITIEKDFIKCKLKNYNLLFSIILLYIPVFIYTILNFIK